MKRTICAAQVEGQRCYQEAMWIDRLSFYSLFCRQHSLQIEKEVKIIDLPSFVKFVLFREDETKEISRGTSVFLEELNDVSFEGLFSEMKDRGYSLSRFRANRKRGECFLLFQRHCSSPEMEEEVAKEWLEENVWQTVEVIGLKNRDGYGYYVRAIGQAKEPRWLLGFFDGLWDVVPYNWRTKRWYD
ncbi:MAG: hypothetical protein ACPLZH_02165 [Minisyncoccales bacterium]